MKVEFLIISRPKAKHVKAGIDFYLKRLTSLAPVEITSVKAEAIITGRSEADIKRAEADRLLARLDQSALAVALDPTGRQIDSEQLAKRLTKWDRSGRNRLSFIIGGPLGLDQTVLDRADEVISLSRLTFSHELSLLIALEAVYRSLSIKAGRPYAK